MITEILPQILELVAPRAGAWIEIEVSQREIARKLGSLPVRERGLKLPNLSVLTSAKGRSPCGSVD